MINDNTFRDLKTLINSTEVEAFKSKMEKTLKDYNNFVLIDNRIAYNYNSIMKYFLKDAKKEIIIPLPIIEDKICYRDGKELPRPPLKSYSPIDLKITNNGMYMKTGKSVWGDISIHRFTNTKEQTNTDRDFSYLLFNDNVMYDKIYSNLNGYGQDIFSRLKELHDAFKLEPFIGKSFRYGINNISPEEKEMFTIRSDDAALFLKFSPNGIFYCISNNGKPYGEPYPTVKLIRAINDDPKGSDYILEKAFIIKHFDDLVRGIELFERYKMPITDAHNEYLNAASKLVGKYVMLDKF